MNQPKPWSGPRPVDPSLDPFEAQHAGLVEIHQALIGSLQTVLAAGECGNVDVLVPQARAAGGFLLGHHHAEDTILFAGLRRLGRLRSSDAAFLEACDRAHHDLHALCERLLAETGAPHPRPSELVALTKAVLGAFTAHVADEEAGLAPQHLRTMISL